jgi:hypothetical protein
MLWAFAAIAMAELLTVHLLVALLWSGTAALLLSIAAAATIVWIVITILALPRQPVLVGREDVTMRLGRLREIRVPLADIVAVRTSFPPGFLRQPQILSLALIAYPNVALELRAPLPKASRRRAGVTCIAHRLDDPARFVAALAERGITA